MTFTPTIILDEHRPATPRGGATLEGLETVVNGAERALTTRGPWDDVTRSLLSRARILRRNLTAQQARAPQYADLHRRVDELDHLSRTGHNPLGDLQARLSAALARLAQEPPSDLTRDLTAILSTPGDAT